MIFKNQNKEILLFALYLIMAKQELVIIFDFDKTIIEFDSDDWIICILGLTHLFNSFFPCLTPLLWLVFFF